MPSPTALLRRRVDASTQAFLGGTWLCLWLAWYSAAQAQTADRQPPAMVRLQAVVLTGEMKLPLQAGTDTAKSTKVEDTLQVFVIIDRDGHARLSDVEPSDTTLRAAITTALAGSEFRPATVAGDAVPARVRIALPVTRPEVPAVVATPAAASSLPESRAQPPAPTPAKPALAAPSEGHGDVPTYGATGRVALIQPTQRHLEPSETRDLPGALGDPFRVIDALPGVVPALSGLPYVYVRGAPPAGTTYYYDGIQVPLLFHLALGPSVVHPAMIGAVDFYASVAPARYGRYTGGVLAGGYSDRPPPTAATGEAELRLIDVNGMVTTPVGKGTLSAAGRYGYPGLILSVFSPNARLAYWDYQTRLDLPLNTTDRFQLTWFGSFDRAGSTTQDGRNSTVTLEFHRAEARLIRRIGRWELGSALQLGYERSEIEQGLQAHSARIGPRLYAQWLGNAGLRVRTGADFMGITGGLHAPQNQDQASFGITTPIYADVAARGIMGAYAELHAPLLPRLALDVGLRSDVWTTGHRAEPAADPRATLTFRSHEQIAWHVAGGLAHQPAVFLLPLPGISDVGTEYGLQSAVQSEAGVAIDLPAELRLESEAYLQRFNNMIFPDLAIDQQTQCGTLPADVAKMTAQCGGGYPRASAWAYGVEALLRRKPSEALSGWLSYTLGWARAESQDGMAFTPSFDVRHVANLVLQYRLGGGWSAGARLQYRSGKMASATFLRDRPIRYEQRLPGFFRADTQVSYSWTTGWGKLRLALEWFNVTLAREPTGIRCRDGVNIGENPLKATPCSVTLAPAIFFPNLGLRAQF